jgi:PAS domain-containing protein
MADQFPTDAAALHAIIADHEDWLVDRILLYAKRQGYSRYTPTLREAWRQAVAGLSAPLLVVLKKGIPDVELGPDEDYASDPLARFGIVEAQRHRERGVGLGMLLGLMKYYRQSYMDLIDRHTPDPATSRRLSYFTGRFFDRIEISLCTAWQAPDTTDQITNLQRANRKITNEKNKYLTIFESLQSPVAVLDRNNCIDTINHAWATLFGGVTVPGAHYYEEAPTNPPMAWLSKEIDRFVASGEADWTVEKQVDTAIGSRYLSVKIKQMLDVSDMFSGCVVILDDITRRKQADSALEETTRNGERLKGALELAGAVCHDMNQPLMAISGYAELLLMDCADDSPHVQKLEKIVGQVAKVGEITRKLMHVTHYETKTYMDRQIIDIDKSSGGSRTESES